jgi:hypothetical protein
MRIWTMTCTTFYHIRYAMPKAAASTPAATLFLSAASDSTALDEIADMPEPIKVAPIP